MKNLIKKYVVDLQKKKDLFESTLNQYKGLVEKNNTEPQLSYQVGLAVMKSFEIVIEACRMSFVRYLHHHSQSEQRLITDDVLRKPHFFQLALQEKLILSADVWKRSNDLNDKLHPNNYFNSLKEVLMIHESFLENLEYSLGVIYNQESRCR